MPAPPPVRTSLNIPRFVTIRADGPEGSEMTFLAEEYYCAISCATIKGRTNLTLKNGTVYGVAIPPSEIAAKVTEALKGQ